MNTIWIVILLKPVEPRSSSDTGSGEGRGLRRELGEPLPQDVEGREQDRLRRHGSIRLELHLDPRRIVRGFHGLDLVLLPELRARHAVRGKLQRLFLLRRRGLHVALTVRDVRVERVDGLGAGLQDRVVPVADPVGRLPVRVLPHGAEDRGRVDQHRLAVPELDDRDLRVLRTQLRVADRLEVRGRHDPGAPLVDGIDDRAVRAAFAVAGRAIFPAVVQREVRRDRDKARIAACAPGPGDFDLLPPGARTRTWIESMPFSFAASATRSAAFIAAYGDASSFAALTTMPPVAFVIVSEPVMSVSVMMMLLYDAKMWATPQRGMVRPPSAYCPDPALRVQQGARGLPRLPRLPPRPGQAAVPSAGPDEGHSRSRSARRTRSRSLPCGSRGPRGSSRAVRRRIRGRGR